MQRGICYSLVFVWGAKRKLSCAAQISLSCATGKNYKPKLFCLAKFVGKLPAGSSLFLALEQWHCCVSYGTHTWMIYIMYIACNGADAPHFYYLPTSTRQICFTSNSLDIGNWLGASSANRSKDKFTGKRYWTIHHKYFTNASVVVCWILLC